MSVVEHIKPSTSANGGPSSDAAAENRSLLEDVEVLIEDGKTYLEAELNFQKARARFAGDRAKRAVLLGTIGFVFAWMALIGLTVGLILTLAPPLGPLGATAVVVVVWLIVAGVTLSMALGRWRELANSLGAGSEAKK